MLPLTDSALWVEVAVYRPRRCDPRSAVIGSACGGRCVAWLAFFIAPRVTLKR